MQKAETILSILSNQSQQNKNYAFQRLYRNLFNEDFYVRAYQRIYAKEGNMTPGTDGKDIDGFSLSKIARIIELMKNERYYPMPVKRVYIKKKKGNKLRPLGIPTFQDKLVQEVIRQMLEAIYEPIFSESSHGFRRNRSCHTALYQIKTKGRSSNWAIEGDIKGCFDNINHEILLKLLSKKIDDGRFIELIRRFLKSGYMEFRTVHNSLSGTPQGQIASPILANIYMHELDKFMESIKGQYAKGKEKKLNPEYQLLSSRRYKAIRKGKKEYADKLLKQMITMPTRMQNDPDFIRVEYVRYADDFVVCVKGSHKLCEEIKDKIAEFLNTELKLEMSTEKTLITNLSDSRAHFLGYEFNNLRCDTMMTTNVNGIRRRSGNGTIQLLVPADVIRDKIKPFSRYGKPWHVGARVNLPIYDMIQMYNAEIRGLYNYYSMATDVSTKIGKFKFYHYTSLLKTIAGKEKMKTVKKVIAKYGVDVKRKQCTGTWRIVGLKYPTTKGQKILTYFNESLKKVDEPPRDVPDTINFHLTKGYQLIKRISSCTCEICGVKFSNPKGLEVHHVRKLKDLKEKYQTENKPLWATLMLAKKRKTLVVCHQCHEEMCPSA